MRHHWQVIGMVVGGGRQVAAGGVAWRCGNGAVGLLTRIQEHTRTQKEGQGVATKWRPHGGRR